MMEYLKIFFEWLKVTLAKETLLTLVGSALSLFLAWITNKIFIYKLNGINNLKMELEILEIKEVEYWIFLFIFFMLLIYAVRFIESIIRTVLIKKEAKE